MFLWVIYDIPSPKRLKKAARLCEQTGLKRIQKSVFLGPLPADQSLAFREKALRWLSPEEDKVLMIPISRDDLAASVELGADCGLQGVLHKPAVLFI